jgi:hypothetical protein
MACLQARHPDKLPSEIAAATARHWPVFPCHSALGGKCSCGKPESRWPGKHPRTPHGALDATSDLRQLEAWAAHFPSSNWGLATGEASGVGAIDVDGTGRAFVADLEQRQ